MVIVIDAYNILKQILGGKFISDHERNIFIRRLGLYAKKRNHTVVAVFDGGLDDRAVKERVYGIYVVYSGLQETADTYMKRYIEEHQQYDLLLVSSDRELCTWAERYNVQSFPALEFYMQVNSVLKSKQEGSGGNRNKAIIKTTDTDNPELDALMSANAGRIDSKQELDSVARVRNKHQLSKKEKKLHQKIKKL
ncbi:MAG TPA: NYN domain-containing protein [Candidatus Babeliales bacterium]|nr:NYN domain-containing protein [Candidatus Babeliales bacterium]